jgi:hypothetical protein
VRVLADDPVSPAKKGLYELENGNKRTTFLVNLSMWL